MIILRIPAALYQIAREDLHRPHAFAGERNGFLFARKSTLASGSHLLLVTDYWSIPDECYIDDLTTAARINSAAIRTALQTVIDTGMSAFSVHEHLWSGRPQFSPTDRRELGALMPSFTCANPSVPHGALIFGLDSNSGEVWVGCDEPRPIDEISVVGFPIRKSV